MTDSIREGYFPSDEVLHLLDTERDRMNGNTATEIRLREHRAQYDLYAYMETHRASLETLFEAVGKNLATVLREYADTLDTTPAIWVSHD